MTHPWRRIRAMTDVEVIWEEQPPGRLAATDGRSVIYMDPRMSQVQRRCAASHEAAHIDLGHRHGCSPVEEAEAMALSSRRLIPMPALLAAYRWAEHLHEVADELWVTVEVLRARIDGLTPAETAELVGLYRAVERGC